MQVFWRYVYPALTWAIDQPYSFFVGLYYDWQWAMLWLSPFIYFIIYLLFIWMTTGSDWKLRERALLFGYSLIPIAFVYNLSHYFTFCFSPMRHGSCHSFPIRLVREGTFFGTAQFLHQPMNPPPARFVVACSSGPLILLGHVVSVYLAHAQALRIFPEGRKALLEPIPDARADDRADERGSLDPLAAYRQPDPGSGPYPDQLGIAPNRSSEPGAGP